MSEPLNPQAGHRQRLREKFLRDGLAKLTDEEVIELLLTFGTPRRDCKQAARTLLKVFGSIRSVFEAEVSELSRIEGVGRNNIVAIKFIYQAAGRFLEQRLIGRDYLSSSKKVFEYLTHHFSNLKKEVFQVIYLDSANGVLALEDISRGTVRGAHVHPREVIERALNHQAAGMVFVHNHPSGKTQPSPDDFRMTRHLVHAARLVEVNVLDHLIVGRLDRYYSFRDQGHLARYEQEFNNYYNARG